MSSGAIQPVEIVSGISSRSEHESRQAGTMGSGCGVGWHASSPGRKVVRCCAHRAPGAACDRKPGLVASRRSRLAAGSSKVARRAARTPAMAPPPGLHHSGPPLGPTTGVRLGRRDFPWQCCHRTPIYLARRFSAWVPVPTFAALSHPVLPKCEKYSGLHSVGRRVAW